MFRQVSFENYRGFQKYAVNDLTPVNLIVGQNNCGKTSILEAIHLLATKGDPAVLTNIAWQRGEVTLIPDDSARNGRTSVADISHFFHGHDFQDGLSFQLKSDNGTPPLTVSVQSQPSEEALTHQKQLFEDVDSLQPELALMLNGAEHPRAVSRRYFPMSFEGGFLLDSLHMRRRGPQSTQSVSPTQFVSSDSLDTNSLRELWDGILLDGNEDLVLDAMRILEPDLSDISFLSSEGALRRGGRSGVLLGFPGKRRVPMGSQGEGMRRLLALSLSLSQAAGGVLLIDEIDTGLHWSIIEDMWKLIISTATQTNTQIFATTHSLDCLRGLASLCHKEPGLGEHASVHRIDLRLEEAVTFDSEQIQIAVDQEIEVRG